MTGYLGKKIVQQEICAEVQKGFWQAKVCRVFVVKATGCIRVLRILRKALDSPREDLSFWLFFLTSVPMLWGLGLAFP